MSKKQTSKNSISKPFTVYVSAKSFTTSSCSKSKRFLSDVVNYSLSPGKVQCIMIKQTSNKTKITNL